MVHVNKKLKKDDSEQKLEDLLFGDNTEDLWTNTGQEFEQELESEESSNEEEGEGSNEVKPFLKAFYVSTKLNWFFIDVLF